MCENVRFKNAACTILVLGIGCQTNLHSQEIFYYRNALRSPMKIAYDMTRAFLNRGSGKKHSNCCWNLLWQCVKAIFATVNSLAGNKAHDLCQASKLNIKLLSRAMDTRNLSLA